MADKSRISPRISVELIPRSYESLEEESLLIKENFPQVDAINIPDLLRFDIRSYEAAALTAKYFPCSIPHIRAMDFDPHGGFEKAVMDMLTIQSIVKQNKLPALLIIKGDKPKDGSRKTFDTDSTELISFFKNNLPGVKIYGAIDQYRGSEKNEIKYIKEKIGAGADGFFTQPFFDIPSMEKYAEILEKEAPQSEVFWGVSPVTTERSKHYWEKLNHVSFSDDFDLSLKGNIAFACQALDFIDKNDSNIYLMPIKVPLKEYLDGVFKCRK